MIYMFYLRKITNKIISPNVMKDIKQNGLIENIKWDEATLERK